MQVMILFCENFLINKFNYLFDGTLTIDEEIIDFS